MPTSLGYQPNYGIGGQQMSSTPGQSLYPEIQTTKANTIPGALNKLQTNSSFALEALKDIKKFTPTLTATTASSVNTAALNAASAGGVGARLLSPGAGADYMGSMFTSGGNNLLQQGGQYVGKQAATKAGLGALGTAMAGIGTAYGLADMGMQIAANKDHRSAGQMRDALTTNTYTTDLGNQYTTHGGVNFSNELDYAKAQRTSRNLNFTAASIGTGMSAGALLGATVGSIAPGVGTAIGAGVGALGGLLAYGLGFGDTEEETKQAASDLADSISMEDKMSKSIALSQDAKQGFYGRTKSGSLGAACGKKPIHARNGKGNAMVSHGEVIGNLNEGWAYREPGIPDNNDTLKRHIAKDDFVISNKYGLSDYAASTGDLVGALQLQDMLMKYNNEKGYKCGKLPKHNDGFWNNSTAQAILASVPHIGALTSLWQERNRLRNSDLSTPRETISDMGASDIASQIMGDQMEARPYLKQANDLYRQANWDATRNVGLGYGGRMVAKSDLFGKMLNYQGDVLRKIDEYNRGQRNAGRELQFKNIQDLRNLYHDSYWKREQENLAKYGAYNNLMSQLPVNLYNVGSSWASNLSNIYQQKESNNIQKEIAKVHGWKTKQEKEIERAKVENLTKWLKMIQENPQLATAGGVLQS